MCSIPSHRNWAKKITHDRAKAGYVGECVGDGRAGMDEEGVERSDDESTGENFEPKLDNEQFEEEKSADNYTSSSFFYLALKQLAWVYYDDHIIEVAFKVTGVRTYICHHPANILQRSHLTKYSFKWQVHILYTWYTNSHT